MRQGEFVWYELCTTNPGAAAEFYARVAGWTIRPAGLPGMDYSFICLGDRPIAGIMALTPDMPPRPAWFGYIAVDDVDAKAKEVAAAGGAIHKPPQDIPTVGRFAVVADPQGAVFMLFKGAGQPPPPLPMMTTGSTGWHTLRTADIEPSWKFYERIFGWSKGPAHALGPAGLYQLFKAGALPAGGFLADPTANPSWLYYFVVDDIEAGLNRVQENGGTLLHGPMEVPGGAWVIEAADPQGAAFALVGMKHPSN